MRVEQSILQNNAYDYWADHPAVRMWEYAGIRFYEWSRKPA